MEIIPPYWHEVHAYAERHTTPETALLGEIGRHTQAHIPMPQMLSGHLQGRLLALFSQLIRPQTILEVGTYTGYATLCLAEGLAPGGVLHTIDKNEALVPLVRQYVQRAGMADRVHLHLGRAADIIPTIEGTFDLVFIDADKRQDQTYYDMVVDRVRSGGLIIVDNVIWKGRVLQDVTLMDARTKAIATFTQYVHADTRVENVLLPIRDGLMVVRKL